MHNWKISKKLYSLTGLFLIILLFSSIFSIFSAGKIMNRLETILADRLIPIHQLSQINALTEDSFQNILLSLLHDPRLKENERHMRDHGIRQHIEKIEKNMQNSDKIWKDYMSTYLTDKESELAKDYSADREELIHKSFQKALIFMKEGRFEELNLFITDSLVPAYKKSKEHFDRLADLQIEVGNQEGKDAHSIYRTVIAGLIIVFIIGAVVLGGFALRIIFSIVVPLQSLSDVTQKISSGSLSISLEEYTSQNEIGILYNSFGKMLNAVRTLIQEMNRMSFEHEKGEIDAKIEEEKFPGEFRTMAKGINEMVFAHITMNKKAISIFDQFGKGNFDAVLEKLPGKMVFINEAVEQVRTNLKSIIADTDLLVQAALEGKISTRADEQKQNGDFRKILGGINRTLESITAPINETSEVLLQMANGDLRVKVKGQYKGDYLNIADALNKTIFSFNSVLFQIQNSSTQILQSSKQLADASQALASDSGEQASNLEEITATVMEIESQAKENSHRAAEASYKSKEAKESAETGNSEMQKMLRAMDEINTASASIARIIKEIDAIAFQTNILALNAAVEAARAGEYGRGFNVVAEEVRNLASRSARAAQETAALIEETQKKISGGVKIAEETAGSLVKIVAGVNQVSKLVEDIATASKEQSEGINQLNTGLNQINQVTMSVASSSEESAAASNTLASQAESFQKIAAKFKLDNSKILNLD